MWLTIQMFIHIVWRWLPAATITLRFVTAAIGCALAGRLAVRRLRRMRQRRVK